MKKKIFKFLVVERVLLEDGFTVAKDLIRVKRKESFSEAKINYIAKRMKKFHNADNDSWTIEFKGTETFITRKDDCSMLVIKEETIEEERGF